MTATKTTDRETTADLMGRLERHYIKPGPMPGGVFVPECSENGMWGASSRCDALYAGFTSASGRILIGHEVKASRSDWRRELDKPGKADAWADQCHAWYVVAPSTDIVHPEELPEDWGLMVVNPRSRVRLDLVVKATVHAERAPSWDAVRSIMARSDTLAAGRIAAIRRDAESNARQAVTKEITDRERERFDRRLADLKQLIGELEQAIGCSISDYRHRSNSDGAVTPDRLGRAIKLVTARDELFGLYGHNLVRLGDAMDKALKDVANLIDIDTQLQIGATR